MRISHFRAFAKIDPTLARGPLATLLTAAFLSIAPVSVYASRATIVLMMLLALLTFLASRADSGPSSHQASAKSPILWLKWSFTSFLFWLALSTSWAADQEHALFELGPVALLLGAGFLLLRSSHHLNQDAYRRLARVGIIAQLALIGFLALELWAGAPLGQTLKGESAATLRFTNHATSIAVLLLWPAVALMRIRGATYWAIATAVALLAGTLAAAQNSASLVALALASVVFLLCLWLRRVVIDVLALAIVVLILATPLLVTQMAPQMPIEQWPSSWSHRMVIWQYFGERSLDAPVIGHGLGASHGSQATVADRQAYERFAQPSNNPLIVEQFPNHPHNTIVQLWFEIGALGIGLFCAFLVACYRHSWRASASDTHAVAHRTLPATGMALLTTYLVLANLSYGAFQEWWLAVVALSLFVWNLAAALDSLSARATAGPCEEC